MKKQENKMIEAHSINIIMLLTLILVNINLYKAINDFNDNDEDDYNYY